MKIQNLKIMAVLLAMFFVTGCAVFVRDDDFHHHHRYYRHWRGSLEQSSQPIASGLAPITSGLAPITSGLPNDMQSARG